MFTGCGTAIVTPFRPDLVLDELTLRSLINRQIEAGVDFLVPCGTTGESPTLSREEHLRVVAITADEARGRVPILAGAGGYDTRGVIALASELKEVGVDGLLSVTPYYNKPTQEGLYRHYAALAAATTLPIIIYSVQGRTGVNVEPSTLVRLADISNVLGVKEASGNIGQIASTLARVRSSFLVLSGDDALTIPVIALGGKGIISVVANEIPAEFRALTRAALDGNFEEARRLQYKYQALMEINFVESNPGPVKYAMARMGLLEPVWRLPMVAPTQSSQARIDSVLAELGMFSKSHPVGAHV